MSLVLVDSSVWIEYFKPGSKWDSTSLESLIGRNQICSNNLILSELFPWLRLKKENKLIDLLDSIEKIEVSIDWEEIQNMQYDNLKQGINKVGIPDLIILQNVLQNNLVLYSLDRHFVLMQKIRKFLLV